MTLTRNQRLGDQRLRLVLIVTVVCAISSRSGTSEAQSLEEALDLESQGRLEHALDAFEAVLASEGNSRRDLATIFEHLAVLRFAAGDEEGAHDAFLRMLAVSPTASMPDAAPPEMEELFDQASSRWAGRTLHAEVEEGAVEDGEVLLEIHVIDDLLDMVGGVQVARGETMLDIGSGYGPDYELRIPIQDWDSSASRVNVRLVDIYGGIIWEGTHRLEIPAEGSRDIGGSSLTQSTQSQRIQRIVSFSLIGAGLAATALGIALVAIDGTETGETLVIDGIMNMQIRNTAAGGWVLIGLGGAAALGGLIWVLLLRSRGPSADIARRLASGEIARW